MRAHPVRHAIIVAAGSSRRLAHLTESRPKCLLEVGGRALIEHSLKALAARGVTELTLVVGYRREQIRAALGDRHGPITIEYAVSEDYATTEHGWSLYQARASWSRERQPVLFLDADDVYHPALIDRVLDAGPDVVLVDPAIATHTQDEELVLGAAGRVSGFRRGRSDDWPQSVGGFVGVNRFSGAFMGALFEFMEDFFARHGHGFKYERVLDAFLGAHRTDLAYVDTDALPWVNVNYEQDLLLARDLVERAIPPDAARGTLAT